MCIKCQFFPSNSELVILKWNELSISHLYIFRMIKQTLFYEMRISKSYLTIITFIFLFFLSILKSAKKNNNLSASHTMGFERIRYTRTQNLNVKYNCEVGTCWHILISKILASRVCPLDSSFLSSKMISRFFSLFILLYIFSILSWIKSVTSMISM